MQPSHGDSTEEFDQSVARASARPLRLRLGHIAVIGAVCGLVTAATRPLLALDRAAETHSTYMEAYAFLWVGFVGVIASGIIILGWERFRRGRPLPHHPGHWLVLYFATSLLTIWTVAGAAALYWSLSDYPWAEYYSWYSQSLAAATCAAPLSVVFARLLGHERCWAAPLWVMSIGVGATAVLYALPFFGFTGDWVWRTAVSLELFGNFIVAVLVARAWRDDIARGQPRDWLHYLGAMILLLGAIISTIFGAYELIAISER